MPRMFMALRQEDRHPIVEILNQTPEIPEACQWTLFLRNHDELTLEMVTDEERDYMVPRYAVDPQMRVNVGIRRRLAPLMENGRPRIELLHGLLLSLPGTPIVYYGDEIGMGDNVYLGDRNGVRTPMQWSSDRNAGFSRSDPARLFGPVIMDPVYGYEAINVEAQERSPYSLLHWMKRMIALRKQHAVFGRGSLQFIPTANRKVLARLVDFVVKQAAAGDVREAVKQLFLYLFSSPHFLFRTELGADGAGRGRRRRGADRLREGVRALLLPRPTARRTRRSIAAARAGALETQGAARGPRAPPARQAETARRPDAASCARASAPTWSPACRRTPIAFPAWTPALATDLALEAGQLPPPGAVAGGRQARRPC